MKYFGKMFDAVPVYIYIIIMIGACGGDMKWVLGFWVSHSSIITCIQYHLSPICMPASANSRSVVV